LLYSSLFEKCGFSTLSLMRNNLAKALQSK